MTYRSDIDALRGLSVIGVVLFHCFPSIFRGGFIGVDIFFVISGYLIISKVIEKKQDNRFSLINFYDRRIRRIFPSLLIIIFIGFIAGWLFLFPEEYKEYASHALASLSFYQNFNLLIEQGYFDISSTKKPLLHLWSLAIEEQFYLFVPLIFCWRLSRSVLFIILLIITLYSFSFNIYSSIVESETIFYHSFSRFWEIGVGGVLAFVYSPLKTFISSVRTPLFYLSISVLIGGFFLFNEDMLYPGIYALVPVGSTVAIILCDNLLKSQHYCGLRYVGLISYPLYLWHWLIISFLLIYTSGQIANLTIIGIIILSIVLSILTYRVEKAIRYSRSKYVSIWLIIALFVILSIGVYIHMNSGLPDRNHLNKDKFLVQFERTLAQDDQCKKYVKHYVRTDLDIDYCRLSKNENESKGKVMLIGDSQAHALYPGLIKYSESHGYSTLLLANSACPGLKDFTWGKNKKQLNECNFQSKMVMQRISTDTSIKKVILATQNYNLHRFAKGDFEDALINTLSWLSNLDHIKGVYYILPNPRLKYEPIDYLLRPFDRYGISAVAERAISEDSIYKKRWETIPKLMKLKRDPECKIKVLDAVSIFSVNRQFYPYLNDIFLYSDKVHYSSFGANYFFGEVDKLLFENEGKMDLKNDFEVFDYSRHPDLISLLTRRDSLKIVKKDLAMSLKSNAQIRDSLKKLMRTQRTAYLKEQLGLRWDSIYLLKDMQKPLNREIQKLTKEIEKVRPKYL